MSSSRRGSALLEALIALTIISVAGIMTLASLSAATANQATTAQRELEMQQADDMMSRYWLLTRDELDQRIGAQRVGAWLLRVQRPEAGLYRVAVARLSAPEYESLVTIFYRPGP